jgi:hypothetical protein
MLSVGKISHNFAIFKLNFTCKYSSLSTFLSAKISGWARSPQTDEQATDSAHAPLPPRPKISPLSLRPTSLSSHCRPTSSSYINWRPLYPNPSAAPPRSPSPPAATSAGHLPLLSLLRRRASSRGSSPPPSARPSPDR